MTSHPAPSITYMNPANGRVSALPYPGYTVRQVKGWTVVHPDGTNGIGHKPFETIADAQAWCDANPNFHGMNQD